MDPFVEQSEHLKMLTEAFRNQSEQGYLWLLLILIGCLPAVCEEALFRGYIQRGFLRKWQPAVSIGVAGLLFAAFHMDPVHSIAVIPLGLWLGYLAWSSKSIWPAVAGHFINNVVSVLTALPDDTGVFDIPPANVTIPIVVFGLIGIGLAVKESRARSEVASSAPVISQ